MSRPRPSYAQGPGRGALRYLPDFIVLVDDGHGDDDLLHLVVEIKGYRREDAKEKKAKVDREFDAMLARAGGASAAVSA